MEKAIADTSAWISSFSKQGHESLKEVLRGKILNGDLAMTGMVLLELLQGVRDDRQYESLKKRLSILPFLSIDDSIWAEVAKLTLHLRSKGVQAPLPDIFISCVSIRNQCVLIHCDSDFERIAKHTDLKTMNFIS